MRIHFFSSKRYDEEHFKQWNQKNELIFHPESLSRDTAILAKEAHAVCVFVNDRVDEACIEILHRLGIQYIALRCTGFNNVDTKACVKKNIRLVNVPSYSPHAVAEHTMALLLTLVRKTHRAFNRVREGNFSLQGLKGFNLHKKTVGIIGLGNIGRVFAQICNGFGCEVIAYDPEATACPNVAFTSFEDLVCQSDIISLHCPLNESTLHMINAKIIAAMKPGVILLNTGRGALIDSQSLLSALKNEKLYALGIDVYEQEAGLFFEDHSGEIIQDDTIMRLTTFPNVLITSHQGFFTDESLDEIARITLKNLEDIQMKGTCSNEIVNAEI